MNKSSLKYISTLIFILTLSLANLFAQNEVKTPYFYSINFRTGKNKPHREVIKNLTYPYRGVDIKFGWQSIGKQAWQVAYRYPSFGVGINWNTFKTDVIGAPVAAYFFTNFPQITTKWARLDMEVDFGLSYGVNPYDPIANPKNFATGTATNVYFGLFLEQSFDIGKHVDVYVSEGFTHYSNGALSYPNLGLNIPLLKFGVRYQPQFEEKQNLGLKPEFKKHWSIITTISGGTKKLFAPTPNYNEINIIPSVYYQPGYKRRLGLGYEIAYNEAIVGNNSKSEYSFNELVTQSVFVAHEFIIERFTVNTQFGIYTRNMPSDKFYYERIGLGFYLTPSVRIVLNLKAHYFKAEYIETGLVFDLNFK